MKKLFGNASGLRSTQIRRLENLYQLRTPPDEILSFQLITDICELSRETNRQIALLVDRSGKIISVIAGDHKSILLPDTSDYRAPPGRLKGLRCIHTHFKDEPLTRDDLTDLALLRLDLMAAVTMSPEGLPAAFHLAHILPDPAADPPYRIYPPKDPAHIDIDCIALIRSIEADLSKSVMYHDVDTDKERAILISVSASPRPEAAASLRELVQLARSCGIHVIDTVTQHRRETDPRFLMGKGKLEDITILAMHKGATLLIFDQELNASQIRSITDKVALKVIDRTQLILDIFAQRAQTREGKLQVELAQLKYLLPRLVTKNTAMSRLTGGIGGRGPGETKLEINRRRARERITRIEKELHQVIKQRKLQKTRREKRGVPVISIIGYTNAGKSTLLNTLTHSHVLAESRLFATLDPTSRRIRFPRDTEVILTDTVGFIRDLPAELRVAFRATLEELERADLLVHVVDGSNRDYAAQIAAVDRIIEELDLQQIRCLVVVNKIDLLDEEGIERIIADTKGIPISAKDEKTLHPLIAEMEAAIRNIRMPGETQQNHY
jgi:GTPase